MVKRVLKMFQSFNSKTISIPRKKIVGKIVSGRRGGWRLDESQVVIGDIYLWFSLAFLFD